MSIQALREKRGTIAAALQELVAKPNWDAANDQPIYDNAMADIDKIDAAIKRQNDLNAKIADEASANYRADFADKKARDTGNPHLALYAKWVRGGNDALNAQEWQAVRNVASTTTGSEGGFTVQSEIAANFIDAVKAFGGMRTVSTIITTETGGPLNYPTTDGTSEEGEQVAENVSATAQDVTFGTVGLPVYKYSSKTFTVPFELLNDSAFNIEALIDQRAVQRIGRITNRMFTTGTGVNQPNGIQVAATIGVTAANGTTQVTAVTYDSLVNLQHSVDAGYRMSGTCGFMFNDNTLRDLRKVKDSSQRPIFVPGYEANNPQGAPDRLLGSPITINYSMPDMAASAVPILFGDFTGYIIRDVLSVQMFRFTDSVYTSKGQVGFLAWMRSGGNLADIGKVRSFRNAAS